MRWWSELPVVAKMRENGQPPTVIFESGSSKGVVMGSRGGAWSGDRCVDVMRPGLVPEGVAMQVKLHACRWEVDVVIREENGYWES